MFFKVVSFKCLIALNRLKINGKWRQAHFSTMSDILII